MRQFIYPYIMFKDSMEAANYYIEVFGGEITYVMRGKDTPNCPEDLLESIMHLQYKLNGSEFYMADQEDVHDHGRIHLHLDFESRDEMEVAFARMAKDGEVIQELNESFWGAVFGAIKDKYGVMWQFHYMIPQE